MDESRGVSSQEYLRGHGPWVEKKGMAIWGESPQSFLATPLLLLENALFENRDWPLIHEKLCKVKEQQ